MRNQMTLSMPTMVQRITAHSPLRDTCLSAHPFKLSPENHQNVQQQMNSKETDRGSKCSQLLATVTAVTSSEVIQRSAKVPIILLRMIISSLALLILAKPELPLGYSSVSSTHLQI